MIHEELKTNKFTIVFSLCDEQIEIIKYLYEQNRKIHTKCFNYLYVIDLLKDGIVNKNSDKEIWLTNTGKQIVKMI